MGVIRTYLAKFTMYRLMVLVLSGLLIAATILSWVSILSFDPIAILVGAAIGVSTCLAANKLLAYSFKVRSNYESAIITGLILALIVGPVLSNWLVLVAASVVAMASKYLLKWHNRHLFNPAAIGVVVTAIALNQGASWWVGINWMTPLVLIGGLLIGIKINRIKLITTFVVSYLAFFVIFNGTNLPIGILSQLLWGILVSSPLLFFALIMLIEPQTSPNLGRYHMLYAILVAGVMVLVQTYLGSINYSIEGALLVGNLATRLIQRDRKYNLLVTRREQLAPGIIATWLTKPAGLTFQPGQFLEWALPHARPDNRGIRRWFTISASPTEPELLITTKLAEKSSTFKQAFQQLQPQDHLSAAGLEGDFTLTTSLTQPLVFLAGGIGITPFRSMIKFLVDNKVHRPITLLYAAKSADEFIFKDLFTEAESAIGLKVRYITGPLDEHAVRASVSDLTTPLVYISGPEPMVEALGETLKKAGVPAAHLKQDFFPGYEA